MSGKISRVKSDVLSFWVKLAYGTGDWSEASYGTLRQIFYAIFLTDVVGLDPRLASFAVPGGNKTSLHHRLDGNVHFLFRYNRLEVRRADSDTQ